MDNEDIDGDDQFMGTGAHETSTGGDDVVVLRMKATMLQIYIYICHEDGCEMMDMMTVMMMMMMMMMMMVTLKSPSSELYYPQLCQL